MKRGLHQKAIAVYKPKKARKRYDKRSHETLVPAVDEHLRLVSGEKFGIREAKQ